MNTPTDNRRLRDLANAITATLTDPTDTEAQRRAGRLAAVAALLLLDEADDRRELLLAILGEAAEAAR